MRDNVGDGVAAVRSYDMSEIYKMLSPIISQMASKPKNWWQMRKKYSKLTESIIKSYLVSRLRDIKLKGRVEADKAVEKMIYDKKREIPSEIFEFMEKNRAAWGGFLFDIASGLDAQALAGFFVPLIYGGIISRKNMSGEFIQMIGFDARNSQKALNDRILSAEIAIEEAKRRGISLIVIEGSVDEIYSQRLLTRYISSPNEAFLIIERESRDSTFEKSSFESGAAAYKREVLSALARSKNVFILLEDNKGDAWASARSRALSSYGILHGFINDGNKSLSNIGGQIQKGSALAVFDDSISLASSIGVALKSEPTVENIISIMPRSLTEFLSAPKLPVQLSCLCELLNALEFIVSCGNIRNVATKMV